MSPHDLWKTREPEEGEPEPELSDSELEEASLFASIEAIVDEDEWQDFRFRAPSQIVAGNFLDAYDHEFGELELASK